VLQRDWIEDKFDLSNWLDGGGVHRAELGLAEAEPIRDESFGGRVR
jgi:hypothetical protein